VPDYLIGLDLGQTADYTALAAVKRSILLDGEGLPDRDKQGNHRYRFHVGHVERFELQTPYPKIVDDVCDLVRAPQLGGRPILCIDATGVGRPVVDLFIQAQPEADIVAITIVAGQEIKWEAYSPGIMGVKVPKSSLVASVQANLQTRRLTIAKTAHHAQTLVNELINFKVKLSAKTAHESYGAARESDHDDLVLAVCMAVWAGMQRRIWYRGEAPKIGLDAPLPSDPDERALVMEIRAEKAREQAAIEAETFKANQTEVERHRDMMLRGDDPRIWGQ
jgi:hypothetical protein